MVYTLISTIVFTILLYVTHSDKGSRDETELQSSLKLLPYLTIFLILLLPIISIGGRSIIWFLVQWSIFGLLLLSAFFHIKVEKINLIVVLLGVTTSLSVIVSMGTSIINMDQLSWGYGPSLDILNQGHVSLPEKAYYAVLPIYPTLIAVVSIISGFGLELSFASLKLVHLAIALIFLSILSFKVTGEKIASVFPLLIILSQPRLDFLFYPLSLSLSFGIMSLYFLYKLLSRITPRLRLNFILFIFTVFISNIAHASGGYMIFWVLITFVVIYLLKEKQVSYTKLVGSTFVILSSYWFQINPSQDFIPKVTDILRSLLSPIVSEPASTPIYKQPLISSQPLSALVWSIPVALAASYVIVGLISRDLFHGKKRLFSYACGIGGCLTVIMNLFVTRSAASTGVERYLNSPSYVMFLLPSAIVLSRLYKSNWAFKVVTTIILFSLLVVGSTSLNWAPDIESNFEQRVFQFVTEQDIENSLRLNQILPEQNLTLGGPFALTFRLRGERNLEFNRYFYRHRVLTIEALYEYTSPEVNNIYILTPSMIDINLATERIDTVYVSYRRIAFYIPAKNEKVS
jgi:hypothetical protein